jgi:hypothetical protein
MIEIGDSLSGLISAYYVGQSDLSNRQLSSLNRMDSLNALYYGASLSGLEGNRMSIDTLGNRLEGAIGDGVDGIVGAIEGIGGTDMSGVEGGLAGIKGLLDSLYGRGSGDCDGYEFECSGESAALDSINRSLRGIRDGIFGDCDGYEFECGNALIGGLGGMCDPSVSDCNSEIVGSGDTTWGITQTAFREGLGALGLDSSSFSGRVNQLLGDTLIVFPAVRNALEPFTGYLSSQLGNGGTVISMNVSVPGLGSCNDCSIDLENFHGVNVKSLFNSILLFSLSLGSLFRIIHVARTVGQSG